MKNKLAFLLFVFCSQIFPQQITLSDTTNQYDYIIITIPEYVQSCQQFKEHKETVRGLKTLIVDTTQIFAEFNSDSLPQNNIREFISYAGSYWQEPKPEYVLFVGTVMQVPNFNMSPSNPYAQTDYYYRVDLNNPDTTEVTFFVGRVPAKTIDEIESYFSKVVEYENIIEPQPWMNNTLFVYEDDVNFGFDFACYYMANLLPTYISPHFISNSDTSIYYGNKDTIMNRLSNEGAALILFMGKSGPNHFIHPDYFGVDDIDLMENHLKYFVSINLAGGAILNINTNITNEMLFLNNAGSLAGFAPVDLAFWTTTNYIIRKWVEDIFNNNQIPLGSLLSLPELSGGSYYYMKKSLNLWGDPSIILNYSTVTNVDNDISAVPNEFSLSQNYPNPFNPSTKIKYTVPSVETLHANRSATYATSLRVTLKVYDVLGKEITMLVNEYKPAGRYEVEFNATGLSSGVYFYKLSVGEYFETKKMTYIR